jgi:hypothetical protein
MTTTEYETTGFPDLKSLDITECYLCHKPLDGQLSSDHIIPNNLFPKGSPYRPQLPTHLNCNTGQKKLEDERFRLRIQLHCSTNPVAEKLFRDFLQLVKNEKDGNDDTSSKPLKYTKLLGTIFGKMERKQILEGHGKEYIEMRGGIEHAEELKSYVDRICAGLFIRNVKGAKPQNISSEWYDYKLLGLRGSHGFPKEVLSLFEGIQFRQSWNGVVRYAGGAASVDKGFVFIEFYGSLGVLAVFD